MNKNLLEEFPNGIKFLQTENYMFTKDAIDLAKFCVVKPSDEVLELCAGGGVVSFYLYGLSKFKKMYLNELQEENCNIINANIELNSLTNIATCLSGDLKKLSLKDFTRKLDVIICNPPYYKCNGANLNFEYSKAISKHEIYITLSEVVKKTSELIKDKGKFFVVMTEERGAELLGLLYQNNFCAKRIKYIFGAKGQVNLMLCEAVYNGKDGVKIEIEKGKCNG